MAARLQFVASGLLVLGLSLTAAAQDGNDSTNHPTGLRPPTYDDLQWMDQNLVKTAGVRLNRLGLERVNQARGARGLSALQLPVADDGDEVIAAGSPKGDAGNQLFDAAVLPSSVDNSTLPSFPPVRDQGQIGSCATFSSGYYVTTHMLGMARGINNKNNADNSNKISPKWLYPMVNGGGDNGSWYSDVFAVLLQHGAATWAEWPYSGVNTPSSYLEWCRDGAVWRHAINNRMNQSGEIANVNTAAGLDNVKTLLANGYAVLYATDIYGWKFTPISDDPSTTADNAFVGKNICYFVAAEASGHAMTCVGYNDDIWCDVNKNGVVDPGEKGAFRICNSWGPNWVPGNTGQGDGGFTWISYDALRDVSAVAGASTPNRAPGNLGSARTGWWYNKAYWISARPSYTPKVLAQFTLNHASRAQLGISLGSSSTAVTNPTQTWQPGALIHQGGPYAFDGTTTPIAGTFVFDLTDLVTPGLTRYYVSMNDNAAGSPASLSDFRLTDISGNALVVASAGVPGNADGSTALARVDYNYNAPVILNSLTTNITISNAFTFTIQASGSPTSFGANGLPAGLTITTNTGVVSGAPTVSGTFVVSLSASSANGTGSGTLTLNISSGTTLAPVISSATTASGTVGTAFSYTITASGNPASFGATGLPPGLNVNTVTGLISGTPTQSGTFPALMSAANAGGTDAQSLTITIAPPAPAVPVVTSAATAQASVDQPFSYRITASGSPTSYGADGLPGELTLNTNSGVLSGTPVLARDYSITLRAINGSGTGYGVLLLSVVGDSSFAPPNDMFANRAVLTGTNVNVAGGNNNASSEPGEPHHADYLPARSVWWSWTAPATGNATVSTIGSDFDTVLAIYTGTNVNALTLVAQDDQNGGTNTSLTNFNATIGSTYQIAVDGFGGAAGNISLHLQQNGVVTAPANDTFANATLLAGTNVSATGWNFGATAQAGEPAHAGFAASKSVWWKWTAPATGAVRVSTIGSTFDTLLAIYTGSAVNALAPVASDDQSGGNNTSLLVFNASIGVTYQIAVDGFQGASGSVALSVQFLGAGAPPLNDDFANRIVINGTNATVNGSNVNATAQSGEPIHVGQPARKSVWWTWTAGSSGLVNLSTAGSSFDTVLEVYTGTSLGALTPVAGSDDADGLLTSHLSFPATAGATYAIVVDGYGGATGNIVLNLQAANGAPANDNFANAFVLAGATPAALGANVNATFQAGEPPHTGFPASHSVWWMWTAPTNGNMTFNTLGSTFDTELAIYTGGAVNLLNYVASNDDADQNLTSKVTFWADAGATYRIAVDGYGGASGNIALTGSLDPAGDRLYATDFETFYQGSGLVVGTDGWEGYSTGGGVQGILTAFNGFGNGAFLGYYYPTNNFVSLLRFVDFQPIAQSRPVVNFSSMVAIVDSSDGVYDIFYVTVYNRAGQILGSIDFDNFDFKIYYETGNGSPIYTGVKFQSDADYQLNVTMNFAANTWSAVLGGAPLFSNQTFNSTGLTRDLGDIDMEWYMPDYPFAGDNFMVFDNYSISASPALAGPVITTQPQSRTNSVGSLASFNVQVSGNAPFGYQWQSNLVDLPGATNASLILLNVTSNQAANYRVRVSNAGGATNSQAASLTVTNAATTVQLGEATSARRGFEFRVNGSAGVTYLVEISTNLTQWSPLGSVQANPQGLAVFMDTTATNRSAAYYRVKPAN